MILSALGQPDTLLPAIVAYAIIVLLAFPLHEYAHAWAAVRLGDTTPYYQGRLTLNPAAHIDPFGALLLAFSFFGWAKPVQFNPNGLRNAPSIRSGIVMVALAGPLMNLAIATVGALIWRAGSESFLIGATWLTNVLFTIVLINVYLAVFNLIPLVPLDGSKVLWGLMPDSWSRTYEQIQQYSMFILLLLIFPINGQSLLGLIMNPPVSALLRLLLGA